MKALLRKLHAPVYERRQRALLRLIGGCLTSGESLLDIGCGSGTLSGALARECGLEARGLETHPRKQCVIPVDPYDGETIPHDDNSFDNVLLADVLHHEEQPLRLLEEACRVAAKSVIVKDHKTGPILAWPRISLIDWAANAGYGVRCLYRYPDLREWHDLFQKSGLSIHEEHKSLDIYPFFLNALFGRQLQYLAVLNPAAP